MYYNIPGNKYYKISNKNSLIRIDKKRFDLKIKNDIVQIHLYDKLYKVSLEWLKLYSMHEVFVPIEYRTVLEDITFIRLGDKSIRESPTKYIVKFPIPFIQDNLNIIPNFSSYGLDSDMNIIELKTGKVKNKHITEYGYIRVRLYDPYKQKVRSVRFHRILALMFINNDDPDVKTIINHNDGDKANNDLNNIKWSTYKENSIHARDTNLSYLNSDRDKLATISDSCIVYDKKENTLTIQPSLSEACLQMNIHQGSLSKSRIINKPYGTYFKNRYDIKLLGDTTKWHFKNLYDNIENIISSGPYYAKNTKTNEIITNIGLRTLAKRTGSSRATITYRLKNKNETTSNKEGWIFSYDKNKWPKVIKQSKKPFKILAMNGENKIVFKSLRKISKFFGVDKKTILNRLKNKNRIKNWKLEQIVN